jgi:cytochrome P450
MAGGIIRQRRLNKSDTGDLLSMRMQAEDVDGSRMTDRQLRDEVTTFLLAGHETTALSLSWIWYWLSEHPDVEEKLQQELCHVLVAALPKRRILRNFPESGVFRTSCEHFSNKRW